MRRAHRPVRDRRADGSAHLRNLGRDATGPDPQARRHRHLRQSAGPQKRRGRASHSRQRRLAPLSAALQSRPQSDRDRFRQAQSAPARQGDPHHRRPVARHRPNLRPLQSTRMPKLLRRRRLSIHMISGALVSQQATRRSTDQRRDVHFGRPGSRRGTDRHGERHRAVNPPRRPLL